MDLVTCKNFTLKRWKPANVSMMIPVSIMTENIRFLKRKRFKLQMSQPIMQRGMPLMIEVKFVEVEKRLTRTNTKAAPK